ncbi:uncharacterized protein TrAtP1_011090 [Trichoderma atroviride]|uniref:uncharacterized protein n=1 Tax=Hypocrea atroviridis TaxID=63577 RepID=UPI00332E77FB|nr:hypothetical protein TrAtP1_011090 [Trichoderma atroviride]
MAAAAVSSPLPPPQPTTTTTSITSPTSTSIPAPPMPSKKSSWIALGCEGSANKLGIGLIRHTPTSATILSNLRHTFISPPGTGFLPKDTALHHRTEFVALARRAIAEAGISPRRRRLHLLHPRARHGRPSHQRSYRRANPGSTLG